MLQKAKAATEALETADTWTHPEDHKPQHLSVANISEIFLLLSSL